MDKEALAKEVLLLLKDELKDFWKEEDSEFLRQLAEEIAKEKFLAMTSDNKEEHKRNLLHLAATLEGEVMQKRLKLNRKGKKFFVRALVMIIKTAALSI